MKEGIEFAKFIWPITLTVLGLMGLIFSVVWRNGSKREIMMPVCRTNFKSLFSNHDKNNDRIQNIEVAIGKIETHIKNIKENSKDTNQNIKDLFILVKNGGKK